MRNKMSILSKISKRILYGSLAVCCAFYLTYITWNLTMFQDTVYAFSKTRLALEAGKLLMTCISELLIGTYIIERINRAD